MTSEVDVMTVYRITCLATNKAYIGITKKAAAIRFAEHCADAKGGKSTGALHAAITKYGTDAFVLETIAVAFSWDAACMFERTLIAEYGTMVPTGYNMTAGGEGTVGWTPPEELREVWSKQRAGRRWTEEQNAARAARVKAQWSDPEFRAARTKSMTGRHWTEEQRTKKSLAMKGCAGRKHTPETKAKISATKRAKATILIAERSNI